MKICEHCVLQFSKNSLLEGRKKMQSMRFCPKGCCFTLSGLSSESEKTNQICVLGGSSAAGGEIMHSKK
jgi:hypothetical protein